MKRILSIFFLLIITIPAYAENPYILSKEGEIIEVEISPLPAFPNEELYLELTVRNTGKLSWTAGDYIVYADLYDASRNLIKRAAEGKGRVTIPSGTSDILLLRFKAPGAGDYSAKAGIILTEDITDVREEYMESSCHDFSVTAKKIKTNFSGSLTTDMEYINLTGNTSGPFVTEGFNIVSDLNLRLDSELGDNKKIESFAHIRATDNPLIDAKTISCEEAYINYLSTPIDVKLGNFYQEFSDYSINNSLEGIAADLKLDKLKIMPFAGREWEAENETQYSRYVYGIRPEYKLIENKTDSLIRDFTIGFNYVSTQDDASSLKSEHESGVSDLDNRVYSADAKVVLNNGLRFETEYAYSRNDADSKGTTPAERGNAFRFIAKYMREKLWVFGKYTRANSRFNSAEGYSVKDKEEYFTRAIYKIANWLSIKPLYREYHDNVDDSKATKTRVRTPELTLSVRPIKKLKDFTIDLSQRRRYRKAGDASVDENWITNEITLNHRIGKNYFDFNYGYRRREDDADDTNDSRTRLYSFGIRSLLELNELRITPSVRYLRDREKLVVSGNKDVTNSAVLGLNFQLHYFDLNLYQTFLDSDRYSADSDYKKVSSDFRLRYKIGGSWDKVLTMGYEIADYNHEDNTLDYTENRAYAKMEFRF
ncbi:MAG: DUF6029 family protein [Candidatus Omnitrophota bacterium]